MEDKLRRQVSGMNNQAWSPPPTLIKPLAPTRFLQRGLCMISRPINAEHHALEKLMEKRITPWVSATTVLPDHTLALETGKSYRKNSKHRRTPRMETSLLHT